MVIASFNLSDLNGNNGFALNGIEESYSGRSVSRAGDINGDDLDDLIVGAGPGGSGASYVIFGSDAQFPASLELTDLDGSNGFTISSSGSIDSGAGDINGDGLDDLIIGSTYEGPSYVIFGSDAQFPASLELTDLDGSNGFTISSSARSVSRAGDINGDGLDDLIIGNVYADPNGSRSGQSYVIFGSDAGFDAELDLSDLDGNNGFVLNGIKMDDRLGFSVSEAGDINGDSIDDLIIGAVNADPNGSRSGQSYVIFGSDAGFDAELDLSDLDGNNGFVLNGKFLDSSGVSVSGAGDINGDGLDDLIIGAVSADPNGINDAGQSYIIFGSSEKFPSSIELSDLDGNNGFALNGINPGDGSGASVSGAGDINGDGLDDLIIGAPSAYPNYLLRSGQSYVVFGFETSKPTPPPREAPIFGTPEDDELNIFDGSVIVFAGEGDDLVDASQSFGNNRIFGDAGNDGLFASQNDQLFGEAGEDILNAAVGSGNNRLYGGDENGILFAGVRDSLFGGNGDDIMFAGDAESFLNGDRGADQFWIANAALPSSPNTITDFELDADVLGIGGLGLNFDDLSFTQQGDDALIAAFDKDLVILSGIQVSDLNNDNFIFV